MNKNISVVQLSTHQQTNMFTWTMSFVAGGARHSVLFIHIIVLLVCEERNCEQKCPLYRREEQT